MPEDTIAGEFKLSNESSNTEPRTTTESSADPAKKLEKPIHKSSPHFFSSFCYYPKNVKFADQEEDEEIILLVRRRFIVNVPWIATSIFFAAIGPFLIPWALSSLPIAPLEPVQVFLLFSLYYIVIFGFVLMKFTLWYFHVGLVTNKRLKDIDIHGVLFKDIAETKISQVQDVNYTQVGFIPSLFNFGTVLVQTAGATPNIEFDRAPEPARIARIIGDMISL